MEEGTFFSRSGESQIMLHPFAPLLKVLHRAGSYEVWREEGRKHFSGLYLERNYAPTEYKLVQVFRGKDLYGDEGDKFRVLDSREPGRAGAKPYRS